MTKMPDLVRSLRFELLPFLQRVYDDIKNGSAFIDEGGRLNAPYANMLGGGKCQSRKTPLKLCTAIMSRLMGVATIVITTSTACRNDLFVKFSEYIGDAVVPHPPVSLLCINAKKCSTSLNL